MEKILFLHGFFASGSCPLASTLRHDLANEAQVLTPDLPLHPQQTLSQLRQLCTTAKPRLLVGNSCGAFYAHLLGKELGLPCLLGNPHFEMSRFLTERIGSHTYKSPRADRQQEFVIDPLLAHEFAGLEATQFLDIPPSARSRVWGLFGTRDTLAHYRPWFERHYLHAFSFPGGHTPTTQETRSWYVPLVRQMLHENF